MIKLDKQKLFATDPAELKRFSEAWCDGLIKLDLQHYLKGEPSILGKLFASAGIDRDEAIELVADHLSKLLSQDA